MTKFNTLTFNNTCDFINSKANSYQRKMYDSLVSIERALNNPSKNAKNVFDMTNDIVNIVYNNNDAGLEGMRSVVDYFYPDKLREGHLKNIMQRIHTAIHNEITKRESRAVEEYTRVEPVEKTPKVEVPVASQSKSIDEIVDDFPTFAESSFPDTDSDVFDKMLMTS